MEGTIRSSSGKETKVSLSLRSLSSEEKRGRAIKALGICWGLALLSAPLPPIHWVTVPGFFLFGIYLGLRRLGEGSFLEAVSFPCPECGKEASLTPQPEKNPLDFVCPHCRYGLKIEWPAPRSS